MDRANYALAQYLAENGNETHLVSYRVDQELASTPNVIVHRVPKPANSYTLADPLLSRIGRLWAARIARGGGRVIVNGGNCNWPDINWVHYVHAAWRPLTGAQALRRFKTTVRHRYALATERRAIGRARLVIANSNRTRRDLQQKLGIDPYRIRTVYYGTDARIFLPPCPAERTALRVELGWGTVPVVVFVGALGDRRKGFDVLFNAWSALCHHVESWDAKLAVVGTGGELATWKRMAAEKGLNESIRFLGFRHDVPKLLRACDVIVAPARYEAYGLGVHEALCCGLPAIVSVGAGVSERIAGVLAELKLPDPGDVEHLIARLRLWRSRREEFAAAAEELSDRLRQRTWMDMAADLVNSVDSASLPLQ
jgi:glycosyltransferase involved in cell wall biosynthesis